MFKLEVKPFEQSQRHQQEDVLAARDYIILSTWEENFLNDLGNGYIRGFIKNGATFIDYRDLYFRSGNKGSQKFISDTISKNNIKVLMYQSGPVDFHFSVEFFKSLQEKVFTVMMLGDTDYFFDTRDVYYAQAMDMVVVYDCLSRYRFRQYGIPSISFYSSYDKDRYLKINSIKKDIDISFVGDIAYRKNRKEYIDHAAQNSMPIKIFGAGSRNGQVSLTEMVEIFNRTRINLNFTGIGDESVLGKRLKVNARLKQMKGRIAEAALCGGFVLSEYVPGIEEVFEIDEEIAVFHSKEEMLKKIKYYLEWEDEREEVADRGYKRALRDYEIGKAIPYLVSRIEDFRRRNAKKPVELHIDKHFIKYYTTFRVSLITEFIRLKKWNLLYEELGIIFKNKKLNIRRAVGFFLFGMFPNLKRYYMKLRRLRNGSEH